MIVLDSEYRAAPEKRIVCDVDRASLQLVQHGVAGPPVESGTKHRCILQTRHSCVVATSQAASNRLVRQQHSAHVQEVEHAHIKR